MSKTVRSNVLRLTRATQNGDAPDAVWVRTNAIERVWASNDYGTMVGLKSGATVMVEEGAIDVVAMWELALTN